MLAFRTETSRIKAMSLNRYVRRVCVAAFLVVAILADHSTALGNVVQVALNEQTPQPEDDDQIETATVIEHESTRSSFKRKARHVNRGLDHRGSGSTSTHGWSHGRGAESTMLVLSLHQFPLRC